MSALQLVCRLILPGKGRRGCRRQPVAPAMHQLADPQHNRPALTPVTRNPYARTSR